MAGRHAHEINHHTVVTSQQLQEAAQGACVLGDDHPLAAPAGKEIPSPLGFEVIGRRCRNVGIQMETALADGLGRQRPHGGFVSRARKAARSGRQIEQAGGPRQLHARVDDRKAYRLELMHTVHRLGRDLRVDKRRPGRQVGLGRDRGVGGQMIGRAAELAGEPRVSNERRLRPIRS